MSRNSWPANLGPYSHDVVGPGSCARQPVWLSMVNWLRTWPLALALTFVVAVVDPTAPAGHAPKWTIATGHLRGVKAVAFSHDGRRRPPVGRMVESSSGKSVRAWRKSFSRSVTATMLSAWPSHATARPWPPT